MLLADVPGRITPALGIPTAKDSPFVEHAHGVAPCKPAVVKRLSATALHEEGRDGGSSEEHCPFV